MIQQRKKDFLQRLIEEFFSKFNELVNGTPFENQDERKELLNKALIFFSENFNVKQTDGLESLTEKIGDIDLLQQYAKLLLIKHDIIDIKDVNQLHTALGIIEYLEAADKTYSWERTTLREDLLRILDEND